VVLGRTRFNLATGAITAASLLIAVAVASSPARAAAPATPSSLAVEGFNNSITATWDAVTPDATATFQSYQVRAFTTSVAGSAVAACSTVAISATSCPLMGLTNGVTFFVSVFAVNSEGSSAQSARASTTPKAVPTKPVITSLGGGNRSIRVTFAPPSTDAGSAVLRYTVRATVVSTGVVSRTSIIDFSLVGGDPMVGPFETDLLLLDNGVYSVSVVATNANGAGNPSDPRSPVTPAGPPDVPTCVIASVRDFGTSVSWSAPTSDNGRPISSYTARAFADELPGLFDTPVASCSGLPRTCLISGLSSGTTCWVDVIATNSAGSGSASSPRVAVTPTGTASATVDTSIDAAVR